MDERGLFPVKASSARLSRLQHFLWQVVYFDLLVNAQTNFAMLL
jgi:hypothetical protein